MRFGIQGSDRVIANETTLNRSTVRAKADTQMYTKVVFPCVEVFRMRLANRCKCMKKHTLRLLWVALFQLEIS